MDARRRLARCLCLLLLLPGAAALADLGAPAPRLGRAVDCVRAVQIGERVACDDEAPAGTHALCRQFGWVAPGPDRVLEGGDAVEPWAACATGRPAERMDPRHIELFGQPVDVNRANEAELASLPGIGPALAGRMVAARPFVSVEDLDRVPGIGAVRLAGLRARARVSP
jgi:hypothetical protein